MNLVAESPSAPRFTQTQTHSIMNKILSIAITLFFFATQVSAQAWADSTGFTAGAKIALHEIWGDAMAYSGKNETAIKAQAKYDNGNFVTITVLNTGVDAKGKIKLLTQKTIQGVYLGNVDATPFGHPGCTVDLYLKKDCQPFKRFCSYPWRYDWWNYHNYTNPNN
ncbi:MAG: hypothetical protein NTW98_01455 [Candidatus Nomurabacteria bacterium]|nr:hypothetical protein [Candidatus Nomurabacteria bacterium]